MVPLILELWGTQKYGVWLSIISSASLIKAITFGHQNYIGNEFSRFYHTDLVFSKKLLESSFWVSLSLGVLEFIIFTLLLFKYPDVFFGSAVTLNLGTYFNQSLLFYVFISSVLGSIGGLLAKIILPTGLYVMSSNLSILHKCLELIILLLAVTLKFQFSLLFIGLGLVNFINTFIVFYYVKKYLPEFFPWWGKFNWKLGIKSYVKSIIYSINVFADQFNSSSIIILINYVINVTAVPIFTTLRTLTNVVIQISNLVTNPLSPELVRFHAKSEFKKLIFVINTNLFIGGILVNLMFLLVSPFVKYFFDWWTVGKIFFDYQLFCILTLSVAFVNVGRSYVTLLMGINDLVMMSIISTSRVLITISVGLLSIKQMGLVGIGIAVLISEIVSSFILPVLFLSKRLNLSLLLLKSPIIWSSLCQIILLAIYYLIQIYFTGILNAIVFVSILIMMLIVSHYQWKLLDGEVKHRLVKLKSNFFVGLSFKNH